MDQGLSLVNSLWMSLLGMSVVFFALVLIMLVIRLISAFTGSIAARSDAKAPVDAPAVSTPSVAVNKVPAPGSLGQLALHGVDDKTAAMLMCIVADELKMPLNQLRFVSIRPL